MKKLIIQSLQKIANPAQGEILTNYMKNIAPFRGVQQPGIQSVLNEYKDRIKELDEYDRFKLGEELVYSKFGEDKKLGLMICQYVNFGPDTINDTKKWFTDGKLDGWAFTDAYCSIILKKFLLDQENAKQMRDWAKHDNLWMRRCSCVGFVTIIKKNPVDMDMLYEICLENIKHEERFNQLGTTWLLREMSVKDRIGVIQFINENIKYFSSEGLRNATEKLSKEDQKKLRGTHSKNKDLQAKQKKRLTNN